MSVVYVYTGLNNSSVTSLGRFSSTLTRMLFFRGQPVLLDHDLAALYEVTRKALNQAVRRNIRRFPDDFMFVLMAEEVQALARLRPAAGSDAPSGRGHHRKYPPLAFTEYGVAMLSSVLRSDRAVQVNIAISI